MRVGIVEGGLLGLGNDVGGLLGLIEKVEATYGVQLQLYEIEGMQFGYLHVFYRIKFTAKC